MGLVDELTTRHQTARAAYLNRLDAATITFNKAAEAYHEEIEAANNEFAAIAMQSVSEFVSKTIGDGEERPAREVDPDPDAVARARVELPPASMKALEDAMAAVHEG